MSNSSRKLVPLGKLIKPHGIKGEMKISLYNEDSKFLDGNKIVYLEDEKNNFYEHKIEKVF